MTIQKQKALTRALVLGGGGVTGLLEAGVNLHEADTVIGTSAGAFVGVALASGHDMNKLFAAQSAPSDSEISVAASEQTIAAWYNAFAIGGSNPQSVGVAFGNIAREILSRCQSLNTVQWSRLDSSRPIGLCRYR